MRRATSASPDVDYNLKAMKLEQMISNPDKVFWPDEGYTKLDIARFYATVFP
jgi:DNA primase